MDGCVIGVVAAERVGVISVSATSYWQYDPAMSARPGGDAETELAPTTLGESEARAYTLDDVAEPAPYRRENSLLRWGVPVGALLLGAAALLGAVGFGIDAWSSREPAPAADPAPQVVETRSPALTHPDRDTAFLMELDQGRILYDSAGAAIHNAKVLCAELGRGRSVQEVANDFAGFGEVQPNEAVGFVTLSAKHYCPGVGL